MAARLLREQLGPGSDWSVVSAGLSAALGMPPSEGAVTVMDESGMDLRDHRSRPVDGDLVDASDVIVVMTASHREQMLALYPGAAQKVFLLKSFDETGPGGDLEDPLGAPMDVYRHTRDEIEEALPGLISFLGELQ